MKTLPLWVYRSSFGDCSNGGITSKADQLYVVCDEGFYDVPEDDPRLVVLVWKRVGRERYAYLEPFHGGQGVGPMFGGCYAGSSDGRFSKMVRNAIGIGIAALPVHDRYETQQLYDALSR